MQLAFHTLAMDKSFSVLALECGSPWLVIIREFVSLDAPSVSWIPEILFHIRSLWAFGVRDIFGDDIAILCPFEIFNKY